MSGQDKRSLLKLQATLTMISMGKKVFFNLATFRKMELITERNVWGKDSTGNKVVVGTKYGLSSKGQKMLEVAI